MCNVHVSYLWPLVAALNNANKIKKDLVDAVQETGGEEAGASDTGTSS